MARREPLVGQAESANPSPDDLRAIAAPVPESICRETGEQGAGPYAGDEFQEFAFDDGRVKWNCSLRVHVFQRPGFRIELHAPDRTLLKNVLAPESADLGETRARIGAEKRHPASNRVAFSCRVTEDQGGFLIREPPDVFGHL